MHVLHGEGGALDMVIRKEPVSHVPLAGASTAVVVPILGPSR
jgi:hypothetical protein